MAVGIQISLNDKLYIRDPQETNLGKRIIKESILLIDEIGFESFTFKKLSRRMESTEASVYRYFENKHMLLLYLVCWYWEWVSYLIDVNTRNVADAKEQLRIIIHTLIFASKHIPKAIGNKWNKSVCKYLKRAKDTNTLVAVSVCRKMIVYEAKVAIQNNSSEKTKDVSEHRFHNS